MVGYDAGEGQSIWFWHDPCYGHTPLKELFPNMFACSLSKEEWISNLVISASEGERSWNLQFRRAFHDWELEGLCSLFEILYSNMLRGEGDDNLTWKLTRSGVFDVRSYYLFLYGSLTDYFPWESI